MNTSAPTFASLFNSLPEASLVRGGDVAVGSIVYDSRAARPGSLFVALRGGYADGHSFLRAARENGAASCLIDRDPEDVDLDGYEAVAIVPDSRQALASISRAFYQDPSRDLRLVGITGTDGKTTTSYMTEHLLQTAGLRTGLIGTIAVHVPGSPPQPAGRQTTPESLDTQRLLAEMRDAGASVAVLETSSHGLATHRVDGCHFDIGVITNITHEHLDFHGSVEAYRNAKGRLFDLVAVARGEGGCGIAIVNMDDPGARAMRPDSPDLDVIEYGETCPDTYRIAAARVEPVPIGYEFDLRIDEQVFRAQLPMSGRWNVSNALAAVAVAHALGVSGETIVEELKTLPAVPGRMQVISAGQPFQVIVDYAHTAPGLRHVLESARGVTAGRVLVLFGSAGERDIEKRREMGAVAAELSDYFVATSEDPRFEDPDDIISQIVDGAVRAGARERVDFDRLEDRRSAIEHILGRARQADTVVLAGKGHEQSMIYGSESRPWDEAGIAIEVLRSLGYSEPR